MPAQLVGFIGVKGSGKTEAEGALLARGFASLAFAGPLRKLVQPLFMLSDDQCTKPELKELPGPLGVSYRRGMQIIGTDIVRNRLGALLPELAVPGERIWIEHAVHNIAALHKKEVPVVVTDARLLNEAQFILDSGGVLIHIQRDAEQLQAFYAANGWESKDPHPSEVGVAQIAETLKDSITVVTNAKEVSDLHAAVCEAVGLDAK